MTEAPDECNKRWSLKEEIEKVFKTALERSFPDLSYQDKEEPCILTTTQKEMGDYECDNVVTLCLKNRPETMLLRHTAEAIKKNLPPNDMIEDCHVQSIGFLTFRLSNTWIAKSVYKMLNEGIETWAPKLPMKTAIVNFSSRNVAEELNVGHLRPAIIRQMLARMLKFSNVYVEFTNHFKDYMSQETLNLLKREEGLIEKSEGDEVIFVKEKKTTRHHILERKEKPLTLVKRNGDFDNALADLTVLRYELVKKKAAQWIVYVADVGEKEYIEMCFTAARRARWLPTDEDEYPKTKFVGCGLVQGDDINKSGKLVDLIDDAKTRCKAALVERVKADELTVEDLENTAEELVYGAVKYALMKDCRVFNYTLNVDEMLSDKGNTGVYLLYTHARICSIINKSGKDIEELKKTRELVLEKDEERELGLHLLQFTEILGRTCETVLPSFMCAFLYELSKMFTSFYSVVCQAVGSADEEANRLLVCEATRVVMTKCFHLLGITPLNKISMTIPPPVEIDDDHTMESFSSDEDKEEMVSTSSSSGEDKEDIVSSSSGEEKTPAKRFKSSDLALEEEEIKMTPPLESMKTSEDSSLEKEKNQNPRFQLFSVHVHVDIYETDCKPCFLFGSISVSDRFVSSEENGWVEIYDPDYGYTDLFDREWSEAVPIVNHDYINALTHPKTQRSIPFIDFLDISAELYVLNKDDNILFQVGNMYTWLGLSDVTYDKFSTMVLHGPDGVVELVYNVISDPVDASLEMKLTTHPADYTVKIFAYYGGAGYDYSSIRVRKDSYYLTLLEDGSVSMSDQKKIIPLTTSVLAVPANGSLVIDVLIKDSNGNVIVKEIFDFLAQRKGSSNSRFEGAGCIFELNVNWK